MGKNTEEKSDGIHRSQEYKKSNGKHTEKDTKHKKQHSDYSKLESGGNARISPEDLGDLVAEADTDTLESYGGVKVCYNTQAHFVFVSSFFYTFTLKASS